MVGRKQHQPTDLTRQTVQLHATVGTNQELIADILDIDPKTLRLHYRVELDQSKAKANAAIGGQLFSKAKGGDTAAMIFWMKTQAGWRETNITELTGPNGGPIQTEEVAADAASLTRRLAGLQARAIDGGDGSPDGDGES